MIGVEMQSVPGEKELKDAFSLIKGRSLPTIPNVVIELQKLLNQQEPDIQRVASTIAEDPAIAGMVLKAVNSSRYGLAREINSISQASVLLGLETLRKETLTSALRKSLGDTSDFSEMFWQSTLAIAAGASSLSASIPSISKDVAYMAGLFQNAGALVFHQIFSDYSVLYRKSFSHPLSILEIENEEYGTNHAVIGYLFAKHWKLPDLVCSGIYRAIA